MLGEGWMRPPSARKFHYYTIEERLPGDRHGFSLCQKYGFMFNKAELNAPTGTTGLDDCTPCVKKLAKRPLEDCPHSADVGGVSVPCACDAATRSECARDI